MVSRADKMYSESPEMERDDAGKMAVKKVEKSESKEEEQTEGEDDSMPVHVRHAQERRDMYNRHETEHSLIDTKGGSKKDVFARQIKEIGDLHKRHDKEGESKATD